MSEVRTSSFYANRDRESHDAMPVGSFAKNDSERASSCFNAGKRQIAFALFVLMCLSLFTPFHASAEEAAVTKVEGEARLNGRLTLVIPELPNLIAAKHDPQKMVLYIDGEPITGLVPLVDLDENALHFHLDLEKGKAAWGSVLGRNIIHGNDVVPVTVGLDNGHVLKGTTVKFRIIQYPLLVIVFGGFLLVALGLFIYLVRGSDILRDRHFTPARGQRRPYSLASTQLAIWFFTVLVSYIFIYLIRLDWSGIPPGVLAVLGISGATALTAKAVDGSKATTMVSQLQDAASQAQMLVGSSGTTQVAQNTATATLLRGVSSQAVALLDKLSVPSSGFLTDILTDADGVSLHRFQIAVWTVVLVAMFLFTVAQTLSMPDLDGTRLTLLGISSLAYLGFKVPEKQA